MISVVATVALAVFATLQVSAGSFSQTDCARTAFINVEDSTLNTTIGGMYVLDLDTTNVNPQYKREDGGAMCLAVNHQYKTAIVECAKFGNSSIVATSVQYVDESF